MDTLQRIKELALFKKVSLAEVERQTNLSSGSITKWDKSSPSADKLAKVADYFNVPVDYLLGREEKKKPTNLTVEEALASVMSSDGKPLTENDREILKGIIEAYIEKSKK